MGTVYRTLCGCLASGEEPELGTPEWDAWNAWWRETATRHHEYCCQERQQYGELRHCLVGSDGECPHIGGQ